MKKHLLYALLFLSFFACNNDKEAREEIIEKTYQEIKLMANSALLSSDPKAEFQRELSRYKGMQGVTDAYVSDNGLFVELEDGQISAWLVKPLVENDFPINAVAGLERLKSDVATGKKICIINQESNDEGRDNRTKLATSLSGRLLGNRWEVHVKNGSTAGLEFFKNLSDYDIIYLMTHGCHDEKLGKTWILTGEVANSQLDKANSALLKEKLIAKMTVTELRKKDSVNVEYYAISKGFIEKYYQKSSFRNSFFYASACQGLKRQDFAKALVDKGVGVVVGWDEINSVGYASGEPVAYYISLGSTLSEAMGAVPDKFKVENIKLSPTSQGNVISQMTFYPQTAGNYTLVKKEIPVTGIALSYTSRWMGGIGRSFPLEATVIPSNAVIKDIIWNYDNTVIGYDDKVTGVVWAKVDHGYTVITAKTVDGGFTATCEVTIGNGK